MEYHILDFSRALMSIPVLIRTDDITDHLKYGNKLTFKQNLVSKCLDMLRDKAWQGFMSRNYIFPSKKTNIE